MGINTLLFIDRDVVSPQNYGLYFKSYSGNFRHSDTCLFIEFSI